MAQVIESQNSAFCITPLDAALGARVTGIDNIESLSASTQNAICKAFLRHHVLVFSGAVMSPLQTRILASHFGAPIAEVNRSKRDGDLPEVSHLNSTITAHDPGTDIQLHHQPAIRSAYWHSDQSFLEMPARATLLHAHEVPSSGGSTCFSDTAAAYDALPQAMKSRIKDLHAVHGYDTSRVPHRAAVRSQQEIDETPEVIHPLVRSHPETGRKALYLNFNRLDRIVQLERKESDALLDELYAWVDQARFVYCHKWAVGDSVVWDNRCTLHRVIYDSPAGERRVMLRVVTRGDRPV